MSENASDSDLAKLPPEAVPRPPSAEDAPAVGQWYWKKLEDDSGGEWLGCVTHVGTNYVALKGPEYQSRVHLDELADVCRREPRAKEIIAEKIEAQRQIIAQSTRQIAAIASRLQLGGESSDTREIASYRGGAVEAYKADLISARDAGLPALQKQIEAASDAMKSWLVAESIPIVATMRESYGSALEKIKKRIAGVELYAGLVEESVKIRAGAPAPPETPVHLFQRRLYMDEECLANYQAGGMTFEDLESFEAWLARDENLSRILPTPRSAVAFRVRRCAKEREGSLIESFVKMCFGGRDEDMLTYLYMRNGGQVHRLSTSIDFGEKLYPDLEHQLVTGAKIYAVMFAGEVQRLATEGEYLDVVESARRCREEVARLPKDCDVTEVWAVERKYRTRDDEGRYYLWDRSSVYYDDITDEVRSRMEEHNRLVLLLQGLFDRSEVFHPHPPYKLWDAADFGRAITLVYDDSRALTNGERPDFAAYQARVNAGMRPGCMAVGQEEAWLVREAERYNKNLERTMRYPDREYAMRKKYRPDGDPGPGVVAEVKSVRGNLCTFTWERRPAREPSWRPSAKIVTDKISVPTTSLLCVDGYRPGDYKIFYADPRTRAEYLQWAPLLLRAEEWHARRTSGEG